MNGNDEKKAGLTAVLGSIPIWLLTGLNPLSAEKMVKSWTWSPTKWSVIAKGLAGHIRKQC
ncbi:hypothetical protein C5167_015048 [Papaver somniferum]|uniref:Uncharacterized protein n=1 Tax=Papaver somniferum TaxID=3469 RepID=A0A4Y7J6U7_PAPSO|nr:hypothetical protein C5167_015048 [Papaver somniferum]